MRCEKSFAPFNFAPFNLAAEVAKRIKDIVGISVAVDVLSIGEASKSEGKAQRVLDLLEIAK